MEGVPHRRGRDPARPVPGFWPLEKSAAGLSQLLAPESGVEGTRVLGPCCNLTDVTFVHLVHALKICPELVCSMHGDAVQNGLWRDSGTQQRVRDG